MGNHLIKVFPAVFALLRRNAFIKRIILFNKQDNMMASEFL
jgi:hypothetical protein